MKTLGTVSNAIVSTAKHGTQNLNLPNVPITSSGRAVGNSLTVSDHNQNVPVTVNHTTFLTPLLESLMNAEMYDWKGRGDNDGGTNGGVKYGTMTQPVPTVDDDMLPILHDESHRLATLLMGASKKDALKSITLLKYRYYDTTLPKNVRDELLRQDVMHMREYPIFLINKACALWVKDPSHKYAPRAISHLMEPVEAEKRKMERDLLRVTRLIAVKKQELKRIQDTPAIEQ